MKEINKFEGEISFIAEARRNPDNIPNYKLGDDEEDLIMYELQQLLALKVISIRAV